MPERRVALITGGTRGIGLGIARSLAAEGWSLALNGVRPDAEVVGVVRDLQDSGSDVGYYRADIADSEQRTELPERVANEMGPIDLLVNNAGVAPTARADVLDADEQSFDRLLGTNLRAPFFLTQAVARQMVERHDGASRRRIVFVTSVSATTASVNRGDYCISKAGLAMAAQLWAVRLAEYGIAVYEVRPGIIATDMTAVVREKYDRMIEDGLLLDARWGLPEDVGRAVAMLARGDLAYSTGSVIMVDGGLTVGRL